MTNLNICDEFGAFLAKLGSSASLAAIFKEWGIADDLIIAKDKTHLYFWRFRDDSSAALAVGEKPESEPGNVFTFGASGDLASFLVWLPSGLLLKINEGLSVREFALTYKPQEDFYNDLVCSLIQLAPVPEEWIESGKSRESWLADDLLKAIQSAQHSELQLVLTTDPQETLQ